jgi:predicted nuclease with TOPRIM domain
VQVSKTSVDLGRRLLDLRKKIDQEKTERAELQGELNATMNQLQKEFGVTTLEAADALWRTKQAALQQMEAELNAKVAELEELMKDD